MVERGANAQTAQHGVGRLGDQMREAAQSLLHEKKERVAMAVEGFADALRHGAWALDRNRQYGAVQYAEHAAARIERISGGVRNHHLGDLAASAERFARRRPALFVAGAVANGFVLSRLLNRPPLGDSPRELDAAQEQP
jgi:hypothetical protein